MGVNKKGQVAIFVIIGIVIVAAIVIFFAVSKTGRGLINQVFGVEIDVKEKLTDCIRNNDNIKEKISLITRQGGSMDPEFYYLNKGVKYQYLCYSSDYYERCVMQHPLVLQEVENEIDKVVRPEVERCVRNLKDDLEKSGYDVSVGNIESSIDIVPDFLNIDVKAPITVRKKDSQKFEEFNVRVSSQIYELIMISTSILNFEARYGDSDSVTYMAVYPEIRVEKVKQSDGTTLYFVSDRNSGEEFNFASRSVAWPPGYG